MNEDNLFILKKKKQVKSLCNTLNISLVFTFFLHILTEKIAIEHLSKYEEILLNHF